MHETALVSGIVGIFGTLAGVLVNHRLSRSAQRDQWVADTKKAEYKELLTVLNESFMIMMELGRPGIAIGPEEQRLVFQAETKSVRTIADRIYVAGEIKALKIMDRWTKATRAFDSDRDIVAFSTVTAQLSEEIRQAALNDIDRS